MPGPILRLAGTTTGDSSDFSVFESCDDMQEALGGSGVNGNVSPESVYHECRSLDKLECHDTHFNGDPVTPSSVRIKVPDYMRGGGTGRGEPRPHIITSTCARPSTTILPPHHQHHHHHHTHLSHLHTRLQDMDIQDHEVDEVEEVVEGLNLPIVSASLSLDLNTSLTRQKITSVRRGPTLTYADNDDDDIEEESPIRRPAPFTRTNESMEVGVPLHLHRFTPTSPTSPQSVSPSVTQRSTRVSRNPSYHCAVRDAAIASPKNTANTQSGDKGSRSCDSSPIRVQMETPSKEATPTATIAPHQSNVQRRHLSESEGLTAIPLPDLMPRSVSYSGQELLSPPAAAGASGSLSESNSRSGSVPQLSATPTHSSDPTLDTKSNPPSFSRGSVISRSFRRFFSTPSRSPASVQQPDECWDDVPGVNISSESEVKSSRLRRISSSFSRKLTTKPRMSSGGSGSNGQPLTTPNGTTTPDDAKSLVEYEDLLKLFCCSGCQSFMAPPLHQCRKGHLVCNSCRFSLKQTCPTCKQRFSESTNMMMEQVCQLVKFPCKYAAQGCQEFHRPKAKQDHEHFCSYRPVHCHHGPQGCPKVLLLRDMHQHLDQCDFKKK